MHLPQNLQKYQTSIKNMFKKTPESDGLLWRHHVFTLQIEDGKMIQLLRSSTWRHCGHTPKTKRWTVHQTLDIVGRKIRV